MQDTPDSISDRKPASFKINVTLIITDKNHNGYKNGITIVRIQPALSILLAMSPPPTTHSPISPTIPEHVVPAPLLRAGSKKSPPLLPKQPCEGTGDRAIPTIHARLRGRNRRVRCGNVRCYQDGCFRCLASEAGFERQEKR